MKVLTKEEALAERRKVRDALLGSKSFARRKEDVQVRFAVEGERGMPEWKEVVVDIVKPNISERGAILTRVTDGNGKVVDPGLNQALTVMTCVYVAGTDLRLFDEGDLDTLRTAHANGWCDQLFNEVLSFTFGKEPASPSSSSETAALPSPSASPATSA